MRCDSDLDQRVAGRAAAQARAALTLEAKHLTVGDACANGDIQAAPVRHGHAPTPALRRFQEVDRQRVMDVAAAAPEAFAGPPPAAEATGQQVHPPTGAGAPPATVQGTHCRWTRATVAIDR